MNFKTLYKISKINIYSKFLGDLIIKIYKNSVIGWLFFISMFLTGFTGAILRKNIFGDSSLYFLFSISKYIFILVLSLYTMAIVCDFLLGNFIEAKIYKKLNFNIPESKTDILTHLIYRNHKNNKPHTSSKLNLEIEKLSRAFDNKSNIYKNLSETDFPYINKFIRRVLQAQSDCKLLNSSTSSTKDSSNLEQLELINPADPADIGKLKMCPHETIPIHPTLLKFYPNLWTLDSIDNELNNIIHNQMKNLNKEKV